MTGQDVPTNKSNSGALLVAMLNFTACAVMTVTAVAWVPFSWVSPRH